MSLISDLIDLVDSTIRNKSTSNRIDNIEDADLRTEIINNLQSDFDITDPNDARYIKNQPSNKILIEGTVNIGNIGGTGSLTVTGGFTSASKTDLGGGSILVTINFPTIGTQNYIMNYNYLNNVVASNMDTYPPIIRTKISTSLSFTIEEGSGTTQDLTMLIQLKQFNGF